MPRRVRRVRPGVALLAVALLGGSLAAGCTPASPVSPAGTVSGEPRQSTATTETTRAQTTSLPRTAAPPTTTPAELVRFDPDAAVADVRAIARFGPRDAVSRAYERAAAHVAGRFRSLGYRVTEQPVPMPAGVSWGVQVPAGTTLNLVVDPPGFDAARPHVVLGAHLDTVPQAPGAEDNASGVAVLLELARMLKLSPAERQVRFVVFGGEEARSASGTRYAFGSRHFVASLRPAERAAVRGMVALDRVGVPAATVPVCSGGRGTSDLATEIRRAARAAQVPTNGCRNRASDHVSFEAAGIPAARLGSVPYDAYHSARDVPSVVDPAQLARTGAVMWAWLH